MSLLYKIYQDDPHATLTPNELAEQLDLTREDLKRSVFYMEEREWVECLKGFGVSLFSGIRIRPDGIDLVENSFHFNRVFANSSPNPTRVEDGIEGALVAVREIALVQGERPQAAGDHLRALERELFEEEKRNYSRIETLLDWLSEDIGKNDLGRKNIELLRDKIRGAAGRSGE